MTGGGSDGDDFRVGSHAHHRGGAIEIIQAVGTVHEFGPERSHTAGAFVAEKGYRILGPGCYIHEVTIHEQVRGTGKFGEASHIIPDHSAAGESGGPFVQIKERDGGIGGTEHGVAPVDGVSFREAYGSAEKVHAG